MKLLRLKLSESEPFRSLQPGFEYFFRTEAEYEKEFADPRGLTPFVCAGPNGSGKSNILELLAAIFFQLEVVRVHRSFLPDALLGGKDTNQEDCPDRHDVPDAYELEYLIALPRPIPDMDMPLYQHVRIIKEPGESPRIERLTRGLNDTLMIEEARIEHRDRLLPDYVVGYSSGENEILSLPFFKMRFIQYDEYWNALRQQLPYAGRPETRLAYLDTGFSQAILICNLLYNEESTLQSFRHEVGIKELNEFRIIIKRSVEVSDAVIESFGSKNEALNSREFSIDVNLMHLMEADLESADNFTPIVTRLKRCATCHYTDPESDTLYLDYYVNDATRQAFSDNFDFDVNKSPIALFQALQVLLNLNLHAVSEELKADIYKSDSHYVNETVPTLASDERIMRFKFVKFAKEGIDEPVMLKSLSDGEHQLLHSLGLCLLFKNTNSLFLLDEPETHFNPDWRSSFITRLRDCFQGTDETHEMLITTHSPFLISDSSPDRVLVFENTEGKVKVRHPDYNTFGASINKITLSTFNKRETIGGRAQAVLAELRARFEDGESSEALIDEIHSRIGDSVERTLLIKSILDRTAEDGE